MLAPILVFSYLSSGDNDAEELFSFPPPTQDGFFPGEIERFQMLYNDYKVNTSMGVENDFYYMSMGLLLRLISKKCLVYEEDKETPIIKINSNYGEHFMLSHPFQQSTDPRICKLSNSTPSVFVTDTNFTGPFSQEKSYLRMVIMLAQLQKQVVIFLKGLPRLQTL